MKIAIIGSMGRMGKTLCDGLKDRFDIVEIYTDLGEINHIENAFGG